MTEIIAWLEIDTCLLFGVSVAVIAQLNLHFVKLNDVHNLLNYTAVS